MDEESKIFLSCSNCSSMVDVSAEKIDIVKENIKSKLIKYNVNLNLILFFDRVIV